ncbi:hypothetical protein DSO57_1000931 [Entomophthora muscae]|uniref:Uncharacterized protein n=1 Tax=Entomophthora muscae TaxID=34485 RepID=A0ACC2TK74_9FUNG|nr:hypothetical protein DSO57_1000931 [Entomophthora muscae]
MKLILWLGLIVGVISQYSNVRVCHPDLRSERKSFHDLDKQEVERFQKAIADLRSTKWWKKFTRNSLSMPLAKGKLLEFNRAMLFRLEQKLKGLGAMLPYWESSRYSQNPARDPVFLKINFGGRKKCKYGKCISRKDISKKTFASREEIELLYFMEKMQTEFGRRVEYGLLPVVTTALYESKFLASQDPLYFLHLAYVDKLWNDWQKRNLQANEKTDTDLKVWNIDHAKVMDTMSHLCYYYRETIHAWEPHLSLSRQFILFNIKGTELPYIEENTNTKGSTQAYLYANTAAPDSKDKSDLCNLRPSSLVPPKYISENNYNMTKFRAIERQGAQLITRLNRKKGYVPQSALTMFSKNPITAKCKDPAYNLAKRTNLKLSKRPLKNLIINRK